MLQRAIYCVNQRPVLVQPRSGSEAYPCASRVACLADNATEGRLFLDAQQHFVRRGNNSEGLLAAGRRVDGSFCPSKTHVTSYSQRL